jgi:hypothetical protein
MQDRRIAFERETLLRLQDELLRLSRGSAESNFFIEAAVNKGAEWTRVMVPDELSERTRLAQAATTALGVRIRNEALRNQVDAFRKTCADFQMPLSKAGSDATFVRMGTQFEALNQSIGQALRQLDDDDLQSTLKQ